jgi:hypothetical protein
MTVCSEQFDSLMASIKGVRHRAADAFTLDAVITLMRQSYSLGVAAGKVEAAEVIHDLVVKRAR